MFKRKNIINPLMIISIISLLLGIFYPIFYYIFNNTLELYVLSPCLFLITMCIIVLLEESNKNYSFADEFKVLIEKINLETGEYQIDKNELVNTDKSELISYIQMLPPISENHPVKPKIINKDFIIEKHSTDRIIISWNYISRFLNIMKKDIKGEIFYDYTTIMRNPAKFYDEILQKVKKIRGGIKFETFLVITFYIITFALILTIMLKVSFTFFQYYILISFMVIIIIGIYYVLNPIIKNDYSRIKIKQHETISNIDPLDATTLLYNMIIIMINLFIIFYSLFNFTDFSSISLIFYMVYPSSILLIGSSIFLAKAILKNKRLIGRIIDHLNEQIQETNDFSRKSFYEQLLSKVKKQKIILIPRIRNIIFSISGSISILTILISFFF